VLLWDVRSLRSVVSCARVGRALALERDTDEGEAGVDSLLPHPRVRDVMVAQLSDGTVALVDTAKVFLYIYLIHLGLNLNIYNIWRWSEILTKARPASTRCCRTCASAM